MVNERMAVIRLAMLAPLWLPATAIPLACDELSGFPLAVDAAFGEAPLSLPQQYTPPDAVRQASTYPTSTEVTTASAGMSPRATASGVVRFPSAPLPTTSCASLPQQ